MELHALLHVTFRSVGRAQLLLFEHLFLLLPLRLSLVEGQAGLVLLLGAVDDAPEQWNLRLPGFGSLVGGPNDRWFHRGALVFHLRTEPLQLGLVERRSE